jgi:hypothetical protein
MVTTRAVQAERSLLLAMSEGALDAGGEDAFEAARKQLAFNLGHELVGEEYNACESRPR